MAIKEETGRDNRGHLYSVRRNQQNKPEDLLNGDIGTTHNLGREDFWSETYAIRKDGYGARNDDEFYSDYTPRDIYGRGPHYGKGPRGYRRSSEKMEEDIYHLLTEHPDLDATYIEVSVLDDEVHLKGEVASREEKWLTEDLVEGVMGVNKIINQIRVNKDLKPQRQSSSYHLSENAYREARRTDQS